MCERRKEQEENCNGLHVRRITQSNNRNNTIFFSPATIIFHSVEIQRTVFNEIVFANMFTLTICNICDFHGPLSTLWHTHTHTLPPHCSWLTFLYALRFFFASQLICARIFFSITDNEMLNTHTRAKANRSVLLCAVDFRYSLTSAKDQEVNQAKFIVQMLFLWRKIESYSTRKERTTFEIKI